MATVRWDSMDFARQASVSVFLVTLTLLLQCAGMAVLIHWVRPGGEHCWRADVWPLRQLPVRDRDSPGRRRAKFATLTAEC